VVDGRIRVLRVDRDCVPPPHYARMAGITGHRADRISDSYWVSPALCYAEATIVDREAAPGARTDYHFWVLHALTPANQNETHYFWANARDCSVGDKAIDEWLKPRSAKVLSEDVVAVERCQDIWQGTRPGRYDEINVAADNPGVQVRRAIAQLAEQEAAEASRKPGGA
jgi:vanillate O-demethylase monooxygenase subunit